MPSTCTGYPTPPKCMLLSTFQMLLFPRNATNFHISQHRTLSTPLSLSSLMEKDVICHVRQNNTCRLCMHKYVIMFSHHRFYQFSHFSTHNASPSCLCSWNYKTTRTVVADCQQFNVKCKVSVWRDHAACTSRSVGFVTRNGKRRSFTQGQMLQHGNVPTLNDLANADGEREGASFISGGVELLSIFQSSNVVAIYFVPSGCTNGWVACGLGRHFLHTTCCQ